MDNDRSCCQAVAQAVLKLFETGFAVDARTAHFIDSTLGCPTREDLLRIIRAPDSDDKALVIDLVIAPDDQIRMAMEACLARWADAVIDVRKVAALLPETLPTILLFPDSRESIPCMVPASAARHLASRLNLSKTIDARIRATLTETMDKPEDRLTVLASLRSARVDLTGPAVPLILAFIKRSPRTDMSLFFSRLRLLLHMLERPGAQHDLFAALAAEQAACLRMISRAARLGKRLAQNNMETLMLQGGRGLLAADTGELQEQILMLDAICLAIFGSVLPAEPLEDSMDVSWDKSDDLMKS